MTSFGVVLCALRRDKGYSQRQAALELGVSQALLSHYENGAREPKLDFVVKACDYYGVPADYILGRIDERSQHYLPAPSGCENAPRLISAICALFNALDEMADPELYNAAVSYLLIPTENAAVMLHEPNRPYEPKRDADLKLAEAEVITLSRRLKAKE